MIPYPARTTVCFIHFDSDFGRHAIPNRGAYITRSGFTRLLGNLPWKVPVPPGSEIGNGQAAVAVSQPVGGLTANTIYTYRVVATYAGGATSVIGASASINADLQW